MSKYSSKILLSTLFLSGSLFAGETDQMKASLADSNWNGNKIPLDQQCQKFKGHGYTPRIRINNIPDGSNAIVIEYSDKTYKAMDNGGHGKIGYYIDDG